MRVEVTTLLLISMLSSVAFADGDGLTARTSIKVNRAKRHQAMQKKDNETPSRSSKSSGQVTNSDPCKGVEIGNVYTDRGATPRDNTVVVTGDVINVPSNKCR